MSTVPALNRHRSKVAFSVLLPSEYRLHLVQNRHRSCLAHRQAALAAAEDEWLELEAIRETGG